MDGVAATLHSSRRQGNCALWSWVQSAQQLNGSSGETWVLARWQFLLHLLRNEEGEISIKVPEKKKSNSKNQLPQNVFKFKISMLARLFHVILCYLNLVVDCTCRPRLTTYVIFLMSKCLTWCTYSPKHWTLGNMMAMFYCPHPGLIQWFSYEEKSKWS